MAVTVADDLASFTWNRHTDSLPQTMQFSQNLSAQKYFTVAAERVGECLEEAC